jgi:membrane protease YdiL (CAAX protease family)
MITFLLDTWQDITQLPTKLKHDRESLAVIILTIVPWCILIIRKPDLNGLQQLGALSVFIAFNWLIYHRQPQKTILVNKPYFETAVALGLVAIWVLYRVGEYWHWYIPPSFGINSCGGIGDVLILKTIGMVIIPICFLLVLKYSLPQMGITWSKGAWLTALIPILALIVLGLSRHPFEQFLTSSTCYFFAAGLPEEFLFRVFLQTRLEAILHRPLWALWIASFIFGLAHIPIDLHGSFTNWPDALLSAFTFQMSAGIALGYAYMCTRNLAPVSIIHMFIDSAF